jgi:protoporphyrin/coproporphyrin ferrochelatase
MSTAILLLAHGTPGKAEDVPAYMDRVTGGRGVPESVIKEVAHRYALIGQSPLTALTAQQADALARKLGMPVYFGMRNWHPFIADTVTRMSADGVTHAVVICLAPQNSRTSVGLYRRATMAAAEGHMTVDFVESWHDHPSLIAAFAEKLDAVMREHGRIPVIFTAHSVPCRTIAGQEADPYSNQAKQTAALVAQLCGIADSDWHFAFQSQGMSGGPWIGPTVEDEINGLKAAGHNEFIIQPVGFVCDHVEVLFDIDILFKDFAARRNMKLWRTESLNDSPRFIAALADLARKALARSPQSVGPEKRPAVVR